jgi:hypothetical protein
MSRWHSRYALWRTGVDEERQDISSDVQRNPDLMQTGLGEGRSAYAARGNRSSAIASRWKVFEVQSGSRREGRGQLGEGRPVFVVPIQGPCTYRALNEHGAPSDLIRKPVQAPRRVRRKLLEVLHLSDLGRNTHEATPVQHQASHGFQFPNRRRQRDHLASGLQRHLVERSELLSAIGGCDLYQVEQPLPAVALLILHVCMEGGCRKHRPVAVAEAVAVSTVDEPIEHNGIFGVFGRLESRRGRGNLPNRRTAVVATTSPREIRLAARGALHRASRS